MTYRNRIPEIEKGITRYKPPKSEIEKLVESHFVEFPDIPFSLPAEEAKGYGFELPENYQLEAKLEDGGIKYYQVPTEEYRLEIESGFSRFLLSDAETGGVWTVYDKAGTVTVFGQDTSSRIYRPDNQYKTYIWNFTRSEDLNGNFMYAVYDGSEYG